MNSASQYEREVIQLKELLKNSTISAWYLETFFNFQLLCRETTGASMNPVRTLGPAIAANNYKAIWVYLTAPFLGALFGAGTYTAVKLPEEDGDHIEKPSTRSFRRWPINIIIRPKVNQLLEWLPTMKSEMPHFILTSASLKWNLLNFLTSASLKQNLHFLAFSHTFSPSKQTPLLQPPRLTQTHQYS